LASTGVYWKPVYAVLEGSELQIVVANAQHVKKVPGHKTDVKDGESTGNPDLQAIADESLSYGLAPSRTPIFMLRGALLGACRLLRNTQPGGDRLRPKTDD
jgi:hypothetical protein